MPFPLRDAITPAQRGFHSSILSMPCVDSLTAVSLVGSAGELHIAAEAQRIPKDFGQNKTGVVLW